ncbi:MAG: hypothetical protein P8Y97_18960, partial [Candidatus Lokiarchaeota archaeon]
MDRQKFWKVVGKPLVENDRIFGTRIFSPLLKFIRLFIMLYLQTKFYKNYANIGKWKDKLVANTFAPPVG